MAGRPSNRDARYTQVMEALTRTVARFGLEGASLSAIAKEAGMTRPLVRHHLGNRDEILTALQAYVLDRFQQQTAEMIDALPKDRPAQALVDQLFDDRDASDADLIMAFAALTARAVDDPALQRGCRDVVLGFEDAIAGVLASSCQVPEKAAKEAAQTITALYFNVISLSPLNMPQDWVATANRISVNILENLGKTK